MYTYIHMYIYIYMYRERESSRADDLLGHPAPRPIRSLNKHIKIIIE